MPGFFTHSRECPECGTYWPLSTEYSQCPHCGVTTKLSCEEPEVSHMELKAKAMAEIESRRKLAAFDAYYANREASLLAADLEEFEAA